MSQFIHAIYEDGVLKPLEPLSLLDHQRVWVSVSAEVPREGVGNEQQGAQHQATEQPGELSQNGPHERGEESFFDVASRLGLIGSIKGTPPDLSTNKKYLDGWGKRDS